MLEPNDKISFDQRTLNKYKSEGNFHLNPQISNPSLAEYLRETVESNNFSRVNTKSQRQRVPSSMVITPEISNKLYEDAQRRQFRRLESIDRNRRRMKSQSVMPNEKSKKYLMKRFNIDFKNAIENQEIEQETINYYNASEILKFMGFLSTQSNAEKNEERILFVDLWR